MRAMLEKATLHTLEQALTEVSIWSMENTYINISLDSIKIWRLNYPYNCYTLDLTNNREVKEKGVKQLFLVLPLLANSSLEVLLQGNSLASNREIKDHRFYSSGEDITLEDLGEIQTMQCNQ